MQLSLEQLSALKTQHENEIQELQRQAEALYGAKTRYNNAKAVLSDASACPNGNQLLIPLNSSLYVPGKIINPEKVRIAHTDEQPSWLSTNVLQVIVELGTGYFCEKDVPEAAKLIDRKVSNLKRVTFHFIHFMVLIIPGLLASLRLS